jgi:hypothetical protein
MTSKFTPRQDRYIIDNKDKMTWKEIADRLGVGDREVVRKRYFTLRHSGKVDGETPKTRQENLDKVYTANLKEPGIQRVETEAGIVIRAVDPAITTLPQLIEHCKIDLNEWRVARWTSNVWNGFAAVRNYEHAEKDWRKELGRVNLTQIKAQLEPNKGSINWDVLKHDLIKAVAAATPRLPKIIRPTYSGDSFMYEISLPDHHFGKLAWAPESGENYDLDIAVDRFKAGFKDLLDRSAGLPIEEILLPFGNDLFHVDSMLNQTTAGTPQDCDGRWQKAYVKVVECLKWAIDLARGVAPVRVLFIPGNHDQQRVFTVGVLFEFLYASESDVTIDNRPTLRKYVQYGKTLLGFTHGNEEAHRDLPAMMADEAPEMWAATSGGHRIWHIGHLHQKEEKTYVGVNVRVMPSLCGTDAWHQKKGYKGPKMAEAHLYHKSSGLYRIETHVPRPLAA